MEQSTIINIVLGIIALLVGAIATYVQSNSKLKGAAVQYIAEAEHVFRDSTKSGGAKFEFVVDNLYRLVPAWLRPVLNRQIIGVIVQNAFDAVQRYAKSQLDQALKDIGGDSNGK